MISTVQDVAEYVWRAGPDYDMNMIRHNDPGTKFIALAVKALNRAGDKFGTMLPAQITLTASLIQVFIHSIGVPTENFLLLMPGERPFGSHSLLENGFTFLLESKQDLPR